MRHSRFFLPTLAAAFLGACNGGGGTPSVSSLPASVSGALQQNGAQRQAGAAFQTLPERASNGPGFKKIYVTNGGGETTYKRNGTQTTPTIAGQYGTWGLTVDANGKIYITQAFGVDTLTTFKPDGTQTTPTITGLGEPYGVAVDANGKIYVVNNTGTVTTYNADGTQTTPTITGLPEPHQHSGRLKGRDLRRQRWLWQRHWHLPRFTLGLDSVRDYVRSEWKKDNTDYHGRSESTVRGGGRRQRQDLRS